MARAVVDTTVLLARKVDTDAHHELAREIVGGIDRGELPTGEVTDTVTIETSNWLHTRADSAAATDMLDRLVEGAHFELVDSPAPVFDDARRIFRRYDGLAFGDAMLVGFMRHHDREYIYSFDDDFDAVDGITRLNAPENPYS